MLFSSVYIFWLSPFFVNVIIIFFGAFLLPGQSRLTSLTLIVINMVEAIL